MAHRDVLIIGGGAIGLSIAYALSLEGVSCSVLDRGPLAREASWAGAGIISPGSRIASPLPLARLRTLSASTFPAWSASLFDETGVDNEYRVCGGLDVAFTPNEENNLRASAGRWRAEGIEFERLGPAELAAFEPCLSSSIRSAYFLPGRAQVRNPRHLRALASACFRRGVALHPHRVVLGFRTSGDRVVSVRTQAGELAASLVVVAAGAWSSSLLEETGLSVPTPPVKGQIVLLKREPGFLRRIVEHGRHYLVPRDDGQILVGATEENTGFDHVPTADGTRDLLELAFRLCPGLSDAPLASTWTGLRPGSRDTRPYIGPSPAHSNLLIATGHFRAGLQLSPGTALVVSDLVLGRPPRIDLDDFRPNRDDSSTADADDSFRS